VLEFLAREISQEKEIQGKGEINLSPFAIDMILYLKDPKHSTKNT
jgi:hypothetical protein